MVLCSLTKHDTSYFEGTRGDQGRSGFSAASAPVQLCREFTALGHPAKGAGGGWNPAWVLLTKLSVLKSAGLSWKKGCLSHGVASAWGDAFFFSNLHYSIVWTRVRPVLGSAKFEDNASLLCDLSLCQIILPLILSPRNSPKVRLCQFVRLGRY